MSKIFVFQWSRVKHCWPSLKSYWSEGVLLWTNTTLLSMFLCVTKPQESTLCFDLATWPFLWTRFWSTISPKRSIKIRRSKEWPRHWSLNGTYTSSPPGEYCSDAFWRVFCGWRWQSLRMMMFIVCYVDDDHYFPFKDSSFFDTQSLKMCTPHSTESVGVVWGLLLVNSHWA